MESLLKLAIRTARRMDWLNDPEMDSIAGQAWMDALRTHDTNKLPIEKWVQYLTRQRVWYYWRKKASRREVFKTEVWWEHVTTLNRRPRDYALDERLTCEEYTILNLRYNEEWMPDVIARRLGMSRNRVYEIIQSAYNKLEKLR